MDKLLNKLVKVNEFFALSEKRKLWILRKVRNLLKLETPIIEDCRIAKVQCTFGLSLTEYQQYEENKNLSERVIQEFAKEMLRAKMLKVHVSVDSRLGQYMIRATAALVNPKVVLNDAPTILDKMKEDEN